MQKKLKIYNVEKDENVINELANILKNNGVIAVPTDTVYGFCAQIYSKDARDEINLIKKRPSYKTLPIMCANLEQIKQVAIINKKAEKLIKHFMPGPITLILRRNNNLPEFINKDSIEIGIRMATSKIIEELILEVGCPLYMTSANLSDEPSLKTAKEIKEKFPMLKGILDGKTNYGKASTIVNCVDEDNISIYREGPISEEEIMNVIKEQKI